MNENFGPAPGAYTPEELLALEGYTPEKLAELAEHKKQLRDQAESQAKAELSQKLHTRDKVELAEPEAVSVTVLLGNGKRITFKDVTDLEEGPVNSDGFTSLTLSNASDNIIARFEPTTWAAYYNADYCTGIA